MKIALVDYQHPVYGFANRDQTGGFGSRMQTRGVVGRLITRLKKSDLRVPITHFGYFSAIAKEFGHTVAFYTAFPGNEDIIIIASSMLHNQYERNFARRIRENNPDARLGFIGPFSTEFPELFEDVADFLIMGEPEGVFRDICSGAIDPVGRLVANNAVDVETLPIPDWDEHEILSYGYSLVLPRKPFLTIQGSRGCPFACEFCPYLVEQGIPLRRRTNESIIEEIEYLVTRYGVKSLLFRDITWSMHKRLTKELCRLIAERNYDLDIGVETRADTLDEELIRLMAEAGVKVVNLGIESPDEKILKESGRLPIRNTQLEKVLNDLEQFGINVQAFYIIGLIDDTESSIINTITYSHKLNTFTAQFCVLTPFPGTKTYDQLKSRLLTSDFSKFTEYTPVVALDNVSHTLIEKYLAKAFNSYYFRLAWLKKHGWKVTKQLLCTFMQPRRLQRN